MQIKVEGELNYLKGILDAIPDHMRESGIIQDALVKSAQATARKIRAGINFKGGRGKRGEWGLKDTVKARKGRVEFGDTALLSVGGKGARQAFNVEFGHGGQKAADANPFVIPVVLATTQDRAKAFIKEIRGDWEKDVMKPARKTAKRKAKVSRSGFRNLIDMGYIKVN